MNQQLSYIELWFESKDLQKQRIVSSILKLGLHAITHFEHRKTFGSTHFPCEYESICPIVWPTLHHIQLTKCINANCQIIFCIKFRILLSHFRDCISITCRLCTHTRKQITNVCLKLCCKNILAKAEISFRKQKERGRRNPYYPTIKQLPKEE